MFEVELFDSGFIWSDGGAFDSNFAFSNGVSGIDGDLVVGGISMFHAKVEVLNIEVKERVDELIFDGFPDDSGHLITIEFCDWVLDFDFGELHRKRYLLK